MGVLPIGLRSVFSWRARTAAPSTRLQASTARSCNLEPHPRFLSTVVAIIEKSDFICFLRVDVFLLCLLSHVLEDNTQREIPNHLCLCFPVVALSTLDSLSSFLRASSLRTSALPVSPKQAARHSSKLHICCQCMPRLHDPFFSVHRGFSCNASIQREKHYCLDSKQS